MTHLQNEMVRTVMADRMREAEHARLVRQVRQARRGEGQATPRRRWALRLRDPLKV